MNRKVFSLFLLFAMVGLAVFAVAAYRSKQQQQPTTAPLPTRTCLDSDAEFGDEDIFVRGFVDVKSDLDPGTARVTDHCRLDRLVEFVCIENPQGSGRFISDARLIDCPGGSRCVSGECLQ